MSGKKKPKQQSTTIALNRRARHDYFIEDRFEAGIALQGWEVKSARMGKVQLTDTYVTCIRGEAWLLGAQFTPLNTASSHLVADPNRTRKLLLNRREIDKLTGAKDRQGYTIICTAMYWKQHLIKVEIALARGKQQHDKRDAEKQKDWDRQKHRIMRSR